MNEPVCVSWSLVLENGEQSQRDDGSRGNVSLTIECVSSGSAFEEEQCNKDEDVGEDAWLVVVSVLSEGCETCNDGEDDGKTVPQAERKVDDCDIQGWKRGMKGRVRLSLNLVGCRDSPMRCALTILWLVASLELVEDGADRRCNEEHHNKGQDCIDPVS